MIKLKTFKAAKYFAAHRPIVRDAEGHLFRVVGFSRLPDGRPGLDGESVTADLDDDDNYVDVQTCRRLDGAPQFNSGLDPSELTL